MTSGRHDSPAQVRQEPARRAIIVAGPTCSGKSALALDLARRWNGCVINADSMQLYRDLRILTARPTPEEQAGIPHDLYGVRDAAEPASAAWWRDAALAAIERVARAGRVPILCGGTGLYFHVLRHGLSAIPNPGPAARQEARRARAPQRSGAQPAPHAAFDPQSAARLHPSDGQRIARAWEVWLGTGRSLASWQNEPGQDEPGQNEPGQRPLVPKSAAILLDPPRPILKAAITARFGAMMQQGALDEASALLRRGLDPSLPAMRAHGVPELAAHLRGEITIDEAAARVIAATCRYTKRQATWFRHHTLVDDTDMHTMHARYDKSTKLSESILADLDNFL